MYLGAAGSLFIKLWIASRSRNFSDVREKANFDVLEQADKLLRAYMPRKVASGHQTVDCYDVTRSVLFA
jgi:hypothetical protein